MPEFATRGLTCCYPPNGTSLTVVLSPGSDVACPFLPTFFNPVHKRYPLYQRPCFHPTLSTEWLGIFCSQNFQLLVNKHFNVFSIYFFFSTHTFSLVTVTDRLSENTPCCTIGNCSIEKKKIFSKLEYVTCEVSSTESWVLLYPPVFSWSWSAVWTPKGMNKQILWRYKFSVQVTRLVLVCHTVYQPCLPEVQ